MGLAFAFMWSSAFSSARIIVQDAPPLMTLSLRFAISGVIAVVVARALGQTLSLNRLQWRNVVTFGVCQNGLYLGLFFVAMQWIEASLAAIIASSMPLIVALLARVFLKERIAPFGLVGLVVGFLGVGIVMSHRLTVGTDGFGLLICAIGVCALALATLSARGAASGGNVLMIVGVQMLIGSAALLGPALVLESWVVNWSPVLVLAFAYTVLVPGLMATWVWFQLVGRIGATRAATFHFLNPFLGVLIAALLLGEHVGLRDYLGVLVIAAGILAVQMSKSGNRNVARG